MKKIFLTLVLLLGLVNTVCAKKEFVYIEIYIESNSNYDNLYSQIRHEGNLIQDIDKKYCYYHNGNKSVSQTEFLQIMDEYGYKIERFWTDGRHIYIIYSIDESYSKIDNVGSGESATDDNRMYNIQGMEINEPKDGEIFIKNGSKYIKVKE